MVMASAAILLSCTGVSMKNVDCIQYEFFAPSVHPDHNRGYIIDITPSGLTLIIKSYDDVLKITNKPFSPLQYDSVLSRFSKMKKRLRWNDEVSIGGSSIHARFYRKGKIVFTAIDQRSGANFSGADIDLTYLVPDLDSLVESTKGMKVRYPFSSGIPR